VHAAYGKGDVTGEVGYDDVRIGFGESLILVQNATLGLIVNDSVTMPSFDGIIGLSYP
jgi:hypothetical protein